MSLRLASAALLVCGLLQGAWSFDQAAAFEDPVQQERYERLNRELRCLQCQNQTIADSTAPLAADLRREVRELMEAGRSDAEIRQFMLDRYGDFVLYRPRMTPANFLLWAAPALLLSIGFAVAIVFIRRRTAEADDDDVESGTGAA